jgi:hypothetical protein
MRVNQIAMDSRKGTMTFPSIATFVHTEVKGSPLEGMLDEQAYSTLAAEAEEKLQSFRTDNGDVVMPLDAFIITAEKSRDNA